MAAVIILEIKKVNLQVLKNFLVPVDSLLKNLGFFKISEGNPITYYISKNIPINSINITIRSISNIKDKVKCVNIRYSTSLKIG